MRVSVIERVFDVLVQRIVEVDDMKLKCNFCVREHGNAVAKEELYLKHFRLRDWLVCERHAALKIFNKEIRNESQNSNLLQPNNLRGLQSLS